MTKIRVYELAQELDMSSKELIEKAEELDLQLSSHMNSLDDEEASMIKELFGKGNDTLKTDKDEIDNIEEDKSAEKTEEKNKKIEEAETMEDTDNIIEIGENIIVKNLADKLEVTPSEIITKLIGLGVMVNQNQSIDIDTAEIIASDYDMIVVPEAIEEEEDSFDLDFKDDPDDLVSRPPVVTVMGHVDHGKTSLLDAIRKENVTEVEAGGITQHIGAYTVKINDEKIVFLDTPGHEAFTSMRARGALVTDLAILVVAADDGVMPQTLEAISHAKAAKVPIIVAINKMDKPTANVERVKQELAENNLLPEEWGGDTIIVPVSAVNRTGIDDLLEMILLVSEMEELKANPDRNAFGVIVEGQLDKGKGPLATVLVKKGTLKVGDMVVSGIANGRVRAMLDDKGNRIDKAGPSIPVVILGLSEVPNAGDVLYAVDDEKTARIYANRRKEEIREEQFKSHTNVSLDDLFEKIQEGEMIDLNIIVKADVRGSMEALNQSLEKLNTEDVNINIVYGGVGGITESDIMLASASHAIVVGFNVRPNLNAIETAKRENVDIRTYRVIYEAIEDIQAAVKGMLAPKFVEEVLGRAEVRATFRLPNGNTIAGIYVLDGKITRNSMIRLLRNDVVIFEGEVSSLRRFKDDVREVASGYEAGLGLENYNDIKDNDMLEAYIMKEVER